jgi:hypothetical protein
MSPLPAFPATKRNCRGLRALRHSILAARRLGDPKVQVRLAVRVEPERETPGIRAPTFRTE